jgi:hypothetical protein
MNKPLKDGCPEWAEDLLAKLREVEILLGHIPDSLTWKSEHLTKVNQRAFAKEEAVFDDKKAEFIYLRVVRGLGDEKFTVEQIAKFINARIGYKDGPPYTNEQEVKEALSSGGQ